MKCNECNGEGGYVYPDGLSSHECKKCKGTGMSKETADQSLKEFYDHGYIEARVNAEWTDTDMVDFLHTYSIRGLNNCKDVLELYKKLKSK